MGIVIGLLSGGIILIIVAIILWHADILEDGAILCGIIGGVLVFVASMVGIIYYRAGREAQIINETFHTEYTADDLFWTGEIVKRNIEGLKIRIGKEK